MAGQDAGSLARRRGYADRMTDFDHLRAEDREHVGYIEMTDDGAFVPYDLLRRRRGEPGGLEEAEAVLDEIGLRLLAEDWILDADGDEPLCVRILEVTRDAVVVAPALDSASVAKSLDLTATVRLPLPTARLRQA